MRILLGTLAAAMMVSPAVEGHSRAMVNILAQGYCGSSCAQLNPGSTVVSIQNLQLRPPAKGQVLVTVTGSGVCYNTGSAVEVADFTVGFTAASNVSPSYTQTGTNRFEFTLPAESNNGLSGNGVFNLASQYTLDVDKNGAYPIYLVAAPNRLDSDVKCGVVTASITAMFIPG